MTISQEAIDTLQELRRMHQLNMKLLEQLAVTCEYLVSNHAEVPNSSIFASLLNKAMTLLNELQSNEPRILQYRRLADEKKHHFRTDEDEPVPDFAHALFPNSSPQFLFSILELPRTCAGSLSCVNES